MDTTISLKKADIMPEVYRITGYTGVKSKDIDAVSSSEDDADILNSYFGEAVSSISDIVSRYGYLSADTDVGSTFCFSLPANWKQSVKTALEKSLKQYVSNYICMQWFNLAKKEEVSYYVSICNEQAVAIRKYLLERERPRRN
jgi:hypothetical protein